MSAPSPSTVVPFPRPRRTSLPPLPAFGLLGPARVEALPEVPEDWRARVQEQELLVASRNAHWALCVALRDVESGEVDEAMRRESVTALYEAARQADGALLAFHRERAATLASRVATLTSRAEAAEELAEGGRIAARLTTPPVPDASGVLEKALLTRFRSLDSAARLDVLRDVVRRVARAASGVVAESQVD